MQAVQNVHLPVYTVNSKRPKIAIALAFVLAILLHITFILISPIKQLDPPEQARARIEIQVDRYEPMPIRVPVQVEATETPLEPLEPLVEESPVPPENVTPAVKPVVQASDNLTPISRQPAPDQTVDQIVEISQQQLQELSPIILSSQFISEQSSTEKIFGRPMVTDPQSEQKAFHFPHKPNMITMLDTPFPDLPFAYTPGLIEFAYEPGVKGDVQRFWDKITPEFGWRTKYGTKVKCVWVLVIAACGWGRSDD